MLPDTKTITIDGVQTRFSGRSEDPYFQSLEAAALGLNALSNVTDRVSNRRLALDIGANIGLTVLFLAQRFEKVIAYEPSPDNLRFLRANLPLTE
jgi:tRNA1(Val) A37 N6-methylase TrmN6